MWVDDVIGQLVRGGRMATLTHRPETDAEIWIAVSKALVTTKRDDFPPAHRRKDQAIEARRLQ